MTKKIYETKWKKRNRNRQFFSLRAARNSARHVIETGSEPGENFKGIESFCFDDNLNFKTQNHGRKL